VDSVIKFGKSLLRFRSVRCL